MGPIRRVGRPSDAKTTLLSCRIVIRAIRGAHPFGACLSCTSKAAILRFCDEGWVERSSGGFSTACYDQGGVHHIPSQPLPIETQAVGAHALLSMGLQSHNKASLSRRASRSKGKSSGANSREARYP
jgi:hypothetical protein